MWYSSCLIAARIVRAGGPAGRRIWRAKPRHRKSLQKLAGLRCAVRERQNVT
jgi:hypothetical protein